MSAPGATSTAHIICRNFRGQSGHNCRLLIEAAVAVTRDIARAQVGFGSSTDIAELPNTSGLHSEADKAAAQRFRSRSDVCAGSWVAVTGRSTGFNGFVPRIWENCHFTPKFQPQLETFKVGAQSLEERFTQFIARVPGSAGVE
jgi:hypothetical protein